MATKKDLRRQRIKFGIRSKISGTAARPRLSVFRSNSTITAQLIDDVKGAVLAFVTSKEIVADKTANVEIAKQVGTKVAEKASAVGIAQVVFDRNGYLYHGKVKAVADGAREGGLQF